jgi:hypothetical protein
MCPDGLAKTSQSSRRIAKNKGAATELHVCRDGLTGNRMPCNGTHICPVFMLWTWRRGPACPHGNIHNQPGLGSVVHIRPNCISLKAHPDGTFPNYMSCEKREVCLMGHDFATLRRDAWVDADQKGQYNRWWNT